MLCSLAEWRWCFDVVIVVINLVLIVVIVVTCCCCVVVVHGRLLVVVRDGLGRLHMYCCCCLGCVIGLMLWWCCVMFGHVSDLVKCCGDFEMENSVFMHCSVL